MMYETDKQILKRIMKLESLAGALYGTLSKASISMDDEDSAEYLFKQLRMCMSHINESDLYSDEEYLISVKNLMTLAEPFKHLPMLKDLYENIRDTYEVFLFNRDTLKSTLKNMKTKSQQDGLRENYWRN